MNHASLFSGIGGFDLAAEWMDWKNLFHCEIDEFNQQILKYYWPNAKTYTDITKTDFTVWEGRIDILTGGFPCQPFSSAGKRLGKDDERHLWPEMLRAIREIKPTWIVGENVGGLLSWNGGMVFDEVFADLENEGYEVTAFVLPACSKGAPHRRDRVWIIAHAEKNYNSKQNPQDSERAGNNKIRQILWSKLGNIGLSWFASNTNGSGQPRQGRPQRQGNSKQDKKRKKYRAFNEIRWPTQSPVRGGNDGIPSELDGITVSKWCKASLMAYGNAIVPHLAHEIFKAIEFINK